MIAHRTLPIALACLLAATTAQAQTPAQNPDWTCQQRLVPSLTAATYWATPLGPLPDWHADPQVAALVAAIAPGDVAVEDGVAAIDAFAKPLSPERRKAVLPVVFIGLVDQINEERSDVIQKIETLTRRQRSLADLVSHVSDELRQVPDNATGAEAQRRDEITQRRDFLIRSFTSTEATMRYACQVPADLEGRLGRYAQALQNAM